MSRVQYSAAMTFEVHNALRSHLLQHISDGLMQEDLCFALWRPSTGRNRNTALLDQVVLPLEGERNLHGGAGFNSQYFERVMALALEAGAGIAFLHNHFGPGWQGMSPEDIEAEQRLAPRAFGTTSLPLVGLTLGTDGAWSARWWPRISRGKFDRQWCGTVRVVGDKFKITYMDQIAPVPEFKEELKRTYSAWGRSKQASLSRLRIGIVGAGSLGALVAEALARMGIEDIALIDFDIVKRHNLDRLLHATVADIGKPKVKVVSDALINHATAANFQVEQLLLNVTTQSGFRAALDCDVLFSCVDRPWPRQVLNMIAYAHLIPVIDAGIKVGGMTSSGILRGADWKSQIAMPGRPCLECLGQFDPAHVTMERQGLLDDPHYIESLPTDHFVHRNENVFGFSMHAASMQIMQFLSMVIQPGGISDVGQQAYHFTTGAMDRNEQEGCNDGCLYPSFVGKGDLVPIGVKED